MKEEARKICQEGGGFWKVLKRLRKLGIPPHRAKRMARRALQGQFLWEGDVEPL